MQDSYYKEKLYPFQDMILTAIGNIHTFFYLTGGTALSRFMLHHRYSDDLDFFANREANFRQEAERLRTVISSQGRVDTWENILSNKISALTRQAAKDVVDILFIALHYPFNWEVAIGQAKQKDAWVSEHEVANVLMNFDLANLKDVAFTPEASKVPLDALLFRQLARERH